MPADEHGEQCAFIDWVHAHENIEPRLKLMFSIPNGARLPWRRDEHGNRFSSEAIRLKAEGLRPGVPDLCLPIPQAGYHGLFLETKSLTGTVRPEQKEFHERLREQGYKVMVCYGCEQLIEATQEYLNMDSQVSFLKQTKKLELA